MQLFGKRRYVVLAFASLVLFWGSAFSVVKVGLEYSPPMIFAGRLWMFSAIHFFWVR